MISVTPQKLDAFTITNSVFMLYVQIENFS